MEKSYISKSLDHLGIVSGMIDELGIVEEIEKHLQIDGSERALSLGLLCKSLIINGLGFTQRTIYMVSTFFEDKPIEQLLGKGIEPSELNDTVSGRCLDDLHAYGCTTLYANLAPEICKRLGLSPKNVHTDSTGFHVDGVYNSRESDVSGQVVQLRQGYSRDHRPDLNQVVLNLIVENEAGIALHMQAMDGNMSDKTAFNNTIKEHIGQLHAVYDIDNVVTDSAGYTEKTLVDCGTTVKWVSRVPETLKESKKAIESTYDNWQPLSEGYKYVPLGSKYANIEQRWLLVCSEEAHGREIGTLKKYYAKGSGQEYHDYLKLGRAGFDCLRDAEKAADNFIKKCKYLSFDNVGFNKVPFFDKKGRPRKEEIPAGHLFYIQADVCCDIARFIAAAQTKGKFIIATNQLDKGKLADEKLLETYKGQSKV